MSQQEDEYFAREEALKLHKLHSEKVKDHKGEEMEALKKKHWMKCPKCGYDLQSLKWRAVEIDKCFHCGVIVLDDGELEQLAGQEKDDGFLNSVFDLFKSKPD